MKNEDLKKYLIQLRDILNQLITHPKETNVQKLKEQMPGTKGEIHIYLIPLLLDAGFEEIMSQGEDLEDESKGSEDSLSEEEDLRYEITAFDKAFLKKWGIRF